MSCRATNRSLEYLGERATELEGDWKPMNDILQRLHELSPAKRALFEQKLLNESKSDDSRSKIPKRSALDPQVLSFAEQRLWFVDQLEPDHPFYNMPMAGRIFGELDDQLFSLTLNEIVARHETLRSTYMVLDGEPQRRVADDLVVVPVFKELLGQSPSSEELQSMIRSEARISFDLEHGPLLRCVVYKIRDDESIVLLVMHHIISDGWSMAVMLQEFANIYDALRRSEPSPLPPLPIQYSDFAAWQRERLSGEILDKQLDYWTRQLDDVPAALELRTDHPRPTIQDFDGALTEIRLSNELSSRINALARKKKATPFMLLMAAYAEVLGRNSRQEDLCVGTVVANRTTPEQEKLIGFFVNTLALRLDRSGDPSFDELIDRVRDTALDAFSHQDLPFEKLVETVVHERDRSHAPLFQAALVFQNTPRNFSTTTGLRIEPMLVDNGTAKYDLTFFFWEEEDQLVGHVEYRTSLFELQTIEGFIAQFKTLLEHVTRDPGQPLSTVSMLNHDERALVVETWNATDAEVPAPHLLHALVEKHAYESPQRPAIRERGKTVTYGELGRMAEHVASYLRKCQIRSEAPVAVCLNRSSKFIAALLGVMKAGGVYVPLDPDQPVERLALISRNSGALLLITDSKNANRLGQVEIDMVDVDDLLVPSGSRQGFSGDASTRTTSEICPSQLAYIIYTSGSTGIPKGVQVEHRSAVNFVRAQTRKMGVDSSSRILQGFAPCFDGSISEVFLGLANGACLVIADRETILDPAALTRLLQSEDVSVGKFSPALLSSLPASELPNLKTVGTAGEALTTELANRWSVGRRFFNGYGPTEATVGVSIFEVHGQLNKRPPIGGPLQNMRMYVLDKHLQPVPIGVPGEICIGGMGVARGYVNDPELTQEKFVADPFHTEKGDHARLYRTGDLGRWNRDGFVEFLGRVDQQLQLRGFRIEPGEIESVIQSVPQVQQSIVALREDQPGLPRLVAYVVPSEGESSGSCDGPNYENEHVDTWLNLFEQTHRAAGPVLDPEFNIAGWVSSYTGRPIPQEDMRQWTEQAAARILDLNPRRVLEIGCGTGLILFRVARHCEFYTGTDFLRSSLDNIEHVLDKKPDLKERVNVLERTACNFDGLADGEFDVVVLNSVVQYFPSIDYLVQVLEGATRVLAPGGKVFLGDVRSFPLQKALAASIELAKAEDSMSRRELLSRTFAHIEREEELLIDPGLFEFLKNRIPRLGKIIVNLKQGPADNELTRYRYDVTLHLDVECDDRQPKIVVADQTTPVESAIRAELASNDADLIQITGIVNPRIAADVAAWNMIQNSDGPETAGEIRAQLVEKRGVAGIDPSRLFQLGRDAGYCTSVSWDPVNNDRIEFTGDRSSVAFPDIRRVSEHAAEYPSDATSSKTGLQEFGNNPLTDHISERLVPIIRNTIKDRLPEYMMPSAFVILDALPRTLQGKVDRKMLPAPPIGRPDWTAEYIAPVDDTEALVADVWEGLLGLRPIGTGDNFFDLGGHSMLAVRMMAEIEKRTGRTLPLAALFQDATVKHLSNLLRNPEEALTASSLVPLQKSGDKPPLFCIHPAGGTVFCYMALADCFRGDRPVFGIQAVGIDGRHPPHSNIEEMTRHYAKVIREAQPCGPYHLAGWSLGGNIAYEVAQRLRTEGDEVGLLALFDSGAIPEDQDLNDEDFLALVMALFPGQDHLSLDALREMSQQEQLDYFIERVAQAGLVPTNDPEAAKSVFQVFQQNIKVVHENRPSIYGGKVTLFRPADQGKTNPLFDDPQLGWSSLAVGGVDVLESPGDHAHMVHEPFVEHLAETVKRCLTGYEKSVKIPEHID